jgi:hypothetical protein
MTQRTTHYGLAPRVLVPILGGGIVYLVAHYIFSEPRAALYAWSIAGASGIVLILQYAWLEYVRDWLRRKFGNQ